MIRQRAWTLLAGFVCSFIAVLAKAYSAQQGDSVDLYPTELCKFRDLGLTVLAACTLGGFHLGFALFTLPKG